ncbi:radical SAM/SPASM domain-containing protein [Nanoarchaeota archaeon]
MGNLYSKMKVFHYKDKIDSLTKDKKVLPPIHIRIKPTNFCNHRCSYCAYREDNLQLGKDMVERDFIPKEKMKEIIEDLIEMDVKAVTFSGGGEPLCYPFILETVKRLAESGIKFSSLTNGSLLKGEIAELFAKHGTWVRVSIDGWDDESYAKFRNVKVGEFTKVMENIKEFKKYGGKCYLSICMNVGRDNASHVHELIMKVKDSGADSVKIAPLIISNNGKENNEYHNPIFKVVKEQIAKAKEEINDPNFEIFDSYHTQLESFEKKYTWCPYLQVLPVIGADQNIYPCQDKAYNLDDGLVGSIKDQRFKEFWFSDKNQFYKINPSVVCNHHCVADSKNKIIHDYLGVDMDHLEFV